MVAVAPKAQIISAMIFLLVPVMINDARVCSGRSTGARAKASMANVTVVEKT
ncbi:hypothetical protein [Aromatoleum petrolei]|uniref:Uncharacterized protein n=1 Tax=Aromatoleum petrolei TaxID=76116 RepID=A0ABX1MIA9_9RHOO|nr:hypothetical protein [Aromatoleum petrolei]NMF87683.1 hypothetical protein [Aromatoleum petrolei]QTQ38168.1 Uncharacterized protein ToN1_40640 [Aromatoleum petrolei]